LQHLNVRQREGCRFFLSEKKNAKLADLSKGAKIFLESLIFCLKVSNNNLFSLPTSFGELKELKILQVSSKFFLRVNFSF
jgi:hypothetical protein